MSDELQLQACLNKIREELLSHQSFPTIRDYYMVSASEDSDALTKLRKAIAREVTNFKVEERFRGDSSALLMSTPAHLPRSRGSL